MVDNKTLFGEIEGAVERIAPGFFPWSDAEHLARYKWAGEFVGARTVLDVACGTGYGSRILLDSGARSVVAIDLCMAALQYGACQYPGPRYVRADAGSFALAECVFDVCVSLETLEHLVDPTGFLAGVKRVLRPSGLLLLSTPDCDRTDKTNPYHISEMTLEELQEALENTGFEVTSLKGQYWNVVPEHMCRRFRVGRAVLSRTVNSHRVLRVPSWTGLRPLYWCVEARKA